jgi:hypothetical protein
VTLIVPTKFRTAESPDLLASQTPRTIYNVRLS